jgi:hypothetical protein
MGKTAQFDARFLCEFSSPTWALKSGYQCHDTFCKGQFGFENSERRENIFIA